MGICVKGALRERSEELWLRFMCVSSLLSDHDLPQVRCANEHFSAFKGAGEVIRGKFHAAINEMAGETQEKEKNEEVVRRGQREIKTGELDKDKSPARSS